ncbi:unnamed protein product [Blepharisma stoltei]|uniref:Uncharacterized protein n=1 Tax=Blepharisma stoltei TaxID=1481888 RepID=A0AAU9JZC3_9CILI|nr:unnamed protein product [Blepharisma stoltei]
MESYYCTYPNCQKDAEIKCEHIEQPPIYICEGHIQWHCMTSNVGSHKIIRLSPKVSEEKARVSPIVSEEKVLVSPKVSEEKARVIEKFFSISEKELKLTIDSALKTTLEVINQVKADLSLIIDRSSEIKTVNRNLYKKLVDYSLGQGNVNLSSNLQSMFKVPDIENYLSKNTIFHYYSINTMASQFEEKWKTKLKAEPNSPARLNPEETAGKGIATKYEKLKEEYWHQINRLQFMESTYMNEIKKKDEAIKEKDKIIEDLQIAKGDLERTNEEIFEENSEINRKKDEEYKSELAIIKDELIELVNRKNNHGDLMAKIERMFNKALSHQVIENKNLKQKFEKNKENKKDADSEMQAKKVHEIINGNNIPMKRPKPDREEQKYNQIPKKNEKSQFKTDDRSIINDLPDMIPKKHQKK